MSNHLFTDGNEIYVASTREQAMEMQRQFIGENPGEDDEWTKCDDDAEINIWINDVGEIGEHGEGVLVIGTCRVWAEAYGSGFLCATEF